MEIKIHKKEENQLAELLSDAVLIDTAEKGLELLGNLYYQGFDHVALYTHNLSSAFFDLSTGLAGEVLQKFSNYKVNLSIIGDFSYYNSHSLNDFIRECNRGKHISFVGSLNEALEKL